jgi:thiol-disulfide isomerase/thioredoxin
MKKKTLNTIIKYIMILTFVLLLLVILYTFFNKNLNEKFTSCDCKIEIYTADWCGHCKDFKGDSEGMITKDGEIFESEFKKLKNKMGNNIVNYVDKTDECKQKMKEHEKNGNPIAGYPTILLVKENGEVIKYSGTRTAENIVDFYNQNTTSCQV